MSERIEFTSNYEDLSTDQGFQFEFKCERCNSGYRSRFKPSMTGKLSGLADAASSVFGGFLSNVSNVTDKIHSATWERAHDDAFVEATTELRDDFVQCPRCSNWVCKKKCWNNKKGLCKSCAPDLGVEMSAAQSSRSVEEIWAHAAMAEEDKKLGAENWRQNIRASCPECNHPLEINAKFCPNCGAKLKSADACPECGAKVQPGAKFCYDCGHKFA